LVANQARAESLAASVSAGAETGGFNHITAGFVDADDRHRRITSSSGTGPELDDASSAHRFPV